MIDEIDAAILTVLQEDARLSSAELARKIGLAPSTVIERIRKLEEKKVIRGYFVDVDPKAVDCGLTVFVQVRTSECDGPAHQALAKIPEVLEVHDVVGEDCYWLKIRTKDTEALSRLLREKIKAIPTVIGTRTTVVLQTFKETMALPMRMEGTGEEQAAMEERRSMSKITPLAGQKGFKEHAEN